MIEGDAFAFGSEATTRVRFTLRPDGRAAGERTTRGGVNRTVLSRG